MSERLERIKHNVVIEDNAVVIDGAVNTERAEGLHQGDLEYLIEQAEKAERLEEAAKGQAVVANEAKAAIEKAGRYERALEDMKKDFREVLAGDDDEFSQGQLDGLCVAIKKLEDDGGFY